MNNTKQISDAIKGLPDDTTICAFCSTCLGQKVIMDFLSGDDVVYPTCKGEDAHDLDIDDLKALVAENESLKERYNELIMAVCHKYEGETRHETALKYIRQSEQGSEATATLDQYGGNDD